MVENLQMKKKITSKGQTKQISTWCKTSSTFSCRFSLIWNVLQLVSLVPFKRCGVSSLNNKSKHRLEDWWMTNARSWATSAKSIFSHDRVSRWSAIKFPSGGYVDILQNQRTTFLPPQMISFWPLKCALRRGHKTIICSKQLNDIRRFK